MDDGVDERRDVGVAGTEGKEEKKGESLRAKRKLFVSFVSSLSTPSFYSDWNPRS